MRGTRSQHISPENDLLPVRPLRSRYWKGLYVLYAGVVASSFVICVINLAGARSAKPGETEKIAMWVQYVQSFQMENFRTLGYLTLGFFHVANHNSFSLVLLFDLVGFGIYAAYWTAANAEVTEPFASGGTV